MDNIQESLFGKTSSAHSTPTEGLTSGSSSTKWLKQGRWQSNGVCWTHNTSEYPNDEGACSSSLSLILSSPTDVQARYYLSPKACQGILRRANRRGKVLPPRLQKALEQMVKPTPTSIQTMWQRSRITSSPMDRKTYFGNLMNKQTWSCPQCKQVITTYIRLQRTTRVR
jgi:hypothetical protein